MAPRKRQVGESPRIRPKARRRRRVPRLARSRRSIPRSVAIPPSADNLVLEVATSRSKHRAHHRHGLDGRSCSWRARKELSCVRSKRWWGAMSCIINVIGEPVDELGLPNASSAFEPIHRPPPPFVESGRQRSASRPASCHRFARALPSRRQDWSLEAPCRRRFFFRAHSQRGQKRGRLLVFAGVREPVKAATSTTR